MKKRMISLVLAVCMTVAMFACLTTAAAAADDKITGYLVSYTFQAGDTIYAVCEKFKIDFNTSLDLIGKINNITNYNYMMPGKVLWLPSKTASAGEPYYTLLAHTLVAGETPAGLCQSYGIDYASNYTLLAALNNNLTTFMAGQTFILPEYITPADGGGSGQGTDPDQGGGSGKTPTGDRLSYYLAQHVLKGGETVSGICAAMGVDFATYDDMIRRLNNITDYGYMFPGQVLLIPSPTKPASGSYYKIMEHTVVSGDTIADLCGKYGLNFGAYNAMILNLNSRQDMTMLYPGEKILMPTYVAAPTSPTTTGKETTPTAPPAATPTPAPGATAAPTAVPTPEPGTITSPTQMHIPSADKVSYLLIPHTVKAGETVSQICADMGIDFAATSDRILQLNNIATYNYILPGRVLLFPSTTFPASGPYYKIMAHVLVAGDTVYDLCTAYGLKYDSNAAFIQRLNNRDNMTTYYVGETIYMPVYVTG